MDKVQIATSIITGIVVIIVSIGGAWIAVKTLLATHEEKIDRIEKDIEEMKSDRKIFHSELKELSVVLNKIYTKVEVLDERTKRQ